MSSHYLAMSAYNGFSTFINNQPTSAPSTSENSSGSSSPPSFRLGEPQTAPLADSAPQPTRLADDDDLGADDDPLEGCFPPDPKQPRPNYNPHHPNHHHHHPYARSNEPTHSSVGQASKLKATTAERRATHNAIERARRESLNGRFLELARALPTMQSVKRPSKSVIVNKSLEWICESQVREYELARENAFLRNQLNELRAQLQMEPLPPTRLLISHGHQVPYGITNPTGAASDPSRNFSSAGPYSLQQPLIAQRSNSLGSKHQAKASALDPHPAPPSTQPLMARQPAAGPFSAGRQPPPAYLSPKSLHESSSSEGSERTAEEARGPAAQAFGSTPVAVDDHGPSLYLPGLALQADTSPGFPGLSEPEAPLSSSTAGSSPTRLRYASSAGSSEGSAKSPSALDYCSSTAAFVGGGGATNNGLLRASGEALHPGGAGNPKEILAPAPADVPLPIEPFEAFHGGPPPPPPPLAGFAGPAGPYLDHSASGSHPDLLAPSLAQFPRPGLAQGTALHAQPFSLPLSNELASGFPLGPPWVWG